MRAELAGAVRTQTLTPTPVHDGGAELAPEAIWRAVLAATRAALQTHPEPTAIEVSAAPDLSLVWDRDTLGAPHPALAGSDRRAVPTVGPIGLPGVAAYRLAGRAAWLADARPHLWALVLDGSYALGGAESYVVARMTRGTYEVTDAAHAVATLLYDAPAARWSTPACARVGVPVEALPEVVAPGARAAVSEAASFTGLALPVRFGAPSAPDLLS